jgi:hypothetical protein
MALGTRLHLGGVKPTVPEAPKPAVSPLKKPIIAGGSVASAPAASSPVQQKLGSGGLYSNPKQSAGNAVSARISLAGGGGSPDSQEVPRSKAAKLMKRQAGIGQLTTRRVEEDEPLI